MGSNTPNFGLYKPDKDENNWASEVNDNFDTIDTNLTDERIQDVVGALLSSGENISLSYDDANDVLTVDTSALNEEEVEDAVAALVTAGNAITVNYDDANDALSIAVNESALSFYDGTNLTADVDNQSVTTENLNSIRYASAFGGSDGGEQIQAAIDALPAEGGTVIVGPNGPDTNGQWVVSSKITLPNDNITVRGVGMGSARLKLADGADVDIFDPGSQSNITISDMEADGNRRNQTIDDSNHVSFVRTFGNVDYLTVERVYAHDFVNNCVNTEKPSSGYSTHVFVRDCILDQNYDPAVDDPSTEYRPAEDVVEFKKTKHFSVTGCWISGAWKAGVEIERSKHGVVGGNVFQETSYRSTGGANAVIIETADEDGSPVWAENVSIVNNSFEDIKQHAVGINGGRDITISGNSMTAVTNIGVEMQANDGNNPANISISNNVLTNRNNTSCIGVRGRVDVDGLLISSNQIRGGDQGIQCDGLSKATIRGNQFIDTDRRGIQIDNGSGCLLAANLVDNPGSHSIDLSAQNGGTADCRLFFNRSVNPSNADLRLGSGSDNTVVWFNEDFGNINDSSSGTDVRWNNGRSSSTASNDGMTADPESGTEDGYLEVELSGTTYQIPFYQA